MLDDVEMGGPKNSPLSVGLTDTCTASTDAKPILWS